MKTRGLGRVYQRGSVWWVQYNHRGKKYRESSGSNRRSDAVKLLRKRQAELASGNPRRDAGFEYGTPTHRHGRDS